MDDAVVDALPVNKGGMTLIGEVEAKELYGVLGPGIECSGGSAAILRNGLGRARSQIR